MRTKLLCWLTVCVANVACGADITIHVDKPGAAVSPTLYGAFFEDINRAGDGGLYAELLQNRSFEDHASLIAWTPLTSSNASARFELDRSVPLNANNPTSLRIQIAKTGGARVGIFNQGFKGIVASGKFPETTPKWRADFEAAQRSSVNGLAIAAGSKYRFTAHLRAQALSGGVDVSLETPTGEILATEHIDAVPAQWKQFELTLAPKKSDANARLVIASTASGTLWLDQVSLMPHETWKGRGLRADLAQMMADMKPGLFRFPGGSYSEGHVLAHSWRWKEHIGDVASRPGTWNIWGYRATGGLGFHEYLQLAEDLGAEPLYVAHVGMAEKDFVPMNDLEPWIQDVLDAIEYANGLVTSKWGALRAKHGHPAPFNLKYVEVGNENGMGYSWGGGTRADYLPRYKAFYERIKAAYPNIVIIANIHTEPDVPADIVDEHYYEPSDWFFNAATLYDSYDRTKPKVYVGEYAVKQDAGNGNMRAALGEAAFLTGLERNADVVQMSSYAPLFANPHWQKWKPVGVLFDNTRVYATPSYHVQVMFATHRPDGVFPVSLSNAPTLFATAGFKRDSGDVILKIVNRGAESVSTRIALTGSDAGDSRATCIEMFADELNAENTFDQPSKIAPQACSENTGSQHVFRPYSVTVLRWSQLPEISGAAQLWLPDLVSSADADVRITFSPDGRRMLWGRIGGAADERGWEILESERRVEGWTPPKAVTFNSTANDFDPSFAPDGSGVYFFSNRPGGLGGDDIYFVAFDAKTGRYGKPVNLGTDINTPGSEWAPVVSPDGKQLMFASDGRGGKGKQDLFVAHRRGKSWIGAENLAELNTSDDDFDATFLHDGHSIVYTSGDVNGVVALYFARFRDGHWLARQRLPEAVNSPLPDAWTFGPAISPSDPGALYFTSRHAVGRGRADIYRVEYRLTP